MQGLFNPEFCAAIVARKTGPNPRGWQTDADTIPAAASLPELRVRHSKMYDPQASIGCSVEEGTMT
jgi:hypothetical protein